MDKHTVTVGFDDGVTSVDEIVSALNDAGYVVKGRTELPCAARGCGAPAERTSMAGALFTYGTLEFEEVFRAVTGLGSRGRPARSRCPPGRRP